MTAFYLTWNDQLLPWPRAEYARDVRATVRGKKLKGDWSFGRRTTGAERGDRAYLFRVGIDRGIVGSAVLTGAPKTRSHWDPNRREKGDVAVYVDLEWDAIVRPGSRLDEETLRRDFPIEPFKALRAGGVKVRDEAEVDLEEAWQAHLNAVRPAIMANRWTREGRCPECGGHTIIGIDRVCPECWRPLLGSR